MDTNTLSHHSTFYFRDGSTVFQVENVLYRLHMSVLQLSSVVFDNMFAIPTSPDHREGMSDEAPVRLGAPVTVEKFDHLLKWLYRSEPPSQSLEALTSILKLSTFLDIKLAHEFAVQALSVSSINFSPTLRLSLALRFHITDWIEPAFKKLIATPTNHIPFEDYRLLGEPVCHLLASTQADIRALRLSIAFNPFPLSSHDPSCKAPVLRCQANWEAAWWGGFAPHYLHPDVPISPSDAISKFETTKIIGVTTACRLRAVEIIKGQHAFEREYDIIEDSLKKLRKFEGTVFNH